MRYRIIPRKTITDGTEVDLLTENGLPFTEWVAGQAGVGPVGPAGPAGTAGTAGTAGSTGPAGTAPITVVVTALPGSPVDGQEVYYLADATNGLVWHLKYRAASTSSYKWEWVGGTELFARANGSDNTFSDRYVDFASGPSLTVPLAGDYLIQFGARVMPGSGRTAYTGVSVGAVAPVDADSLVTFSNIDRSESTKFARAAIAAASLLKVKYGSESVSTASWDRRWLQARPSRVG